MHVDWVLLCYAAVSAGTAVVGALLLPRGLLRAVHVAGHHIRELLDYVKWMVPAMMLAAVNERMDVFLIYSFLGSDQAGLYGRVLTVAMIPEIFSGCVVTVLQPRIARLHASGAFNAEFRRFLLFSVPACLAALLAAILLAEPVLSLIFGPRYIPVIPAFEWLLAATLLWLAVAPMPLALVAVLTPGRTLWLTILQTATIVASGLLLLPLYGLTGMAMGVFTTRVVLLAAMCRMARTITISPPAAAGPEMPEPALP